MKRSISLLLVASTYLVGCIPPHPAVVSVRQAEERLPLHLRNPAQFNPHLQEILPLTSLLHHGEKPVFDRDTDKISRSEIYNILIHAGFLARQRQRYPHHNQLLSGNLHSPLNYDPSFYNPELLQYL